MEKTQLEMWKLWKEKTLIGDGKHTAKVVHKLLIKLLERLKDVIRSFMSTISRYKIHRTRKAYNMRSNV